MQSKSLYAVFSASIAIGGATVTALIDELPQNIKQIGLCIGFAAIVFGLIGMAFLKIESSKNSKIKTAVRESIVPLLQEGRSDQQIDLEEWRERTRSVIRTRLGSGSYYYHLFNKTIYDAEVNNVILRRQTMDFALGKHKGRINRDGSTSSPDNIEYELAVLEYIIRKLNDNT